MTSDRSTLVHKNMQRNKSEFSKSEEAAGEVPGRTSLGRGVETNLIPSALLVHGLGDSGTEPIKTTPKPDHGCFCFYFLNNAV